MLVVDASPVHRLRAYRRRPHIGQIEAVLAKLGKRLDISVCGTAWYECDGRATL